MVLCSCGGPTRHQASVHSSDAHQVQPFICSVSRSFLPCCLSFSRCTLLVYCADLPPTSIIIAFHRGPLHSAQNHLAGKSLPVPVASGSALGKCVCLLGDWFKCFKHPPEALLKRTPRVSTRVVSCLL